MTEGNGRLERARQYLGIAESKDAKREAYKAAANEIVAHKQETNESFVRIAIRLGRVGDENDQKQRDAGSAYISAIAKWHKSGFKAETPFLADGNATGRASVSHTKKILREGSTEEIKELLDDLPDEVIEKVAEATEESRITRRLYPDKPKPSHKQAVERAKAGDTEMLKKNQYEALARLGSTCGSARAAVRVVVRQYEEFLAIVDDEDFREDGRESVVGLRADVDLALGSALEGSIEEAFAQLLNNEEGVK
jgi:hypothetical protein